MSRMPALFLCLLAVFPVAAFPQPRYSSSSLRDLAERRFERVRIEEAGLEQSRLTAASARTARFPHLDLTAQYTHISEYGKIEFSIPGLPVPPRTISFGDGNIAEAAVSVTAPLFTGFRLTAAEAAAEERVRMAERTVANAVLEARLATLRSCRLAQAARASIAIVDTQRASLERLLDFQRRRLEQGQAIPFDTLVIAARIAQLAVERASAEGAFRNALASIRQLTGLEGPFDIEDEPPGFEIAAETRSLRERAEELSIEAFRQRYDLLNLGSAKVLAEHGATSARAGMYPSIFASASFRFGRPGVDQVKNEWMDYYTVGIRMDWNLWNWHADRRAVEAQELEARKIDLQIAALRNTIRTRIDMALNDLETRCRTLELLTIQADNERAKLELTRARLRQGLATPTDVVEAETALTTALLRHEQALCEYLNTRSELGALLGKEW
ncbi:MAG: TolC family protein [Bacteroidota bacterium]|nr:TolC family protein [Bacteroidota bacterium]